MSSKDSVMKEANKIIEKELGITLDLHLIDMGNYDERCAQCLLRVKNGHLLFKNRRAVPQRCEKRFFCRAYG